MVRTLSLSRIKIPEDFKKTSPKEYKLIECKTYWEVFGEQDRYIVLDSKNVLIDGYVQYLVLQEFGAKECKAITYFGDRNSYNKRWSRIDNDIYVWGKHLEDVLNEKDYVWKIPKRYIITGLYRYWKVGDEILVQTKYGEKRAIITKIGRQKDYSNFNLPKKIKPVVINLNSYKAAMREYDIEIANMLGY